MNLMSFVLATLVSVTVSAADTTSKTEKAPEKKTGKVEKATEKKGDKKVEKVLMETSEGNITIELDSAKAPESVKNFLAYVDSGFYDGTIFHRVIESFMIQGGGFTADMKQKTTKAPIKNEADNGLKNVRGSLAMARTSDPNSATAQFFINVVDNDFLNHRGKTMDGWGYAVFGKVDAKSLEVVDKIKKVATGNKNGMDDVPTKTVTIKKVKKL